MAGSSTQIVPAPRDYDVTITSFGHTEEELRAAIEGEPDADDEGEKPALDPDPAKAAKPAEEPAKVEEPPVTTPADGQEAFEPAPTGKTETADERADRLERNVARLVAQNAKLTSDTQTAALREQNARLEGEVSALRSGRQVEPSKPTPAPEPPKFEFPTWEAYQAEHPEAAHEEYIDARTDARIAFHRTIDAATAARNHAVAAGQQLFNDAKPHIESFRLQQPDFDAVLAASAAPLTPAMHQAMLKSGASGPAIAYHLAKPEHLEEARRIARLEPIDQAREIGVLAVTLKGGEPKPKVTPEPEKKPVTDMKPVASVLPVKAITKAPEPLAVVPGSTANTDPASMSADEWVRKRRQDWREGRK